MRLVVALSFFVQRNRKSLEPVVVGRDVRGRVIYLKNLLPMAKLICSGDGAFCVWLRPERTSREDLKGLPGLCYLRLQMHFLDLPSCTETQQQVWL